MFRVSESEKIDCLFSKIKFAAAFGRTKELNSLLAIALDEHPSECMTTKKTSFLEPSNGRLWQDCSLIEFAAWAGDLCPGKSSQSVLNILLRYTPHQHLPTALAQLQAVIDHGTEHGEMLSPYETLADSYERYANAQPNADLSALKTAIATAQRMLPMVGKQEMCDPAKAYWTERDDPVIAFTTPPPRTIPEEATPFLLGISVIWIKVKDKIWADQLAHRNHSRETISTQLEPIDNFIATKKAQLENMVRLLKNQIDSEPDSASEPSISLGKS